MNPRTEHAQGSAQSTSSDKGNKGTGGVRIPHELISRRAYEKWVKRGRPKGAHLQDWLEAERELQHELAAQGAPEKWVPADYPGNLQDWLEAERQFQAELVEKSGSSEPEVSAPPSDFASSAKSTAPSNEPVTYLELLHALVWQLLDVNPEVRLEAISKMRELGSAVKLALPDIINTLNDPEEIIRHNAFRLLSAVCPDVENDAASLATENVETRLAVIRKLVTLSEVKDAIATRNPSWPSLEPLTSPSEGEALGCRENTVPVKEKTMNETHSPSYEPALPDSGSYSTSNDPRASKDLQDNSSRKEQLSVQEVMSITPQAYLRSLVAIAWSAFRHPFSTTVVDLSTGESVHLKTSSDSK